MDGAHKPTVVTVAIIVVAALLLMHFLSKRK